jgi:hypothetical protein
VPAAVLDGAGAGEEAVRLELVEQADEVRAIDAQRLGHRLLGAAAVVAQERQRDEVARAQVQRRQGGLGAGAVEAGEVVEQRRRAVGGRRLAHAHSLVGSTNALCAVIGLR